nr:purine-nucleoside phosphorylase [uncultured Desulfuromonas sp.]
MILIRSEPPEKWHKSLENIAPCDTAIILGSGWSEWAESLDAECVFDYRDLFSFTERACPKVSGHAGKLKIVTKAGQRLLVFQGRFHLYQGLSSSEVAQTVRLAHAMGCRRILLTNAVGGIAPTLIPGDFVVIEDHLNFQGDNPLRGISDDPFVDLTGLYDCGFFPKLQQWAQLHQMRLSKGVLAAVVGPSYETPAEIRAFERFGADVVSMSMVPEAIMARYLGLKVVGLSLVTNEAAGRSSEALNHQDVLQCAETSRYRLSLLLDQILQFWS